MPIREYACASGHTVEQIEFTGDEPLADCPQCGSPVKLLPSVPVAKFVGYGWTPKHHHRGLRAEWKSGEDTLEEDGNGRLRTKTGAGHDFPGG